MNLGEPDPVQAWQEDADPALGEPLVVADLRDPMGAILAAPRPEPDRESLTVDRSFAFVDICGFTAYCDRFGEQHALDLLTEFRQITRAVVGRRGVRVSKWLGDGVMLVGLDPPALAAVCAEIGLRCSALLRLDTHAGMATGPVMLLEGDDYVGRTVNLAARLCDIAGARQVLVTGPLPRLPHWLEVTETKDVRVPGVDSPVRVSLIGVTEETRQAFVAVAPMA